MMAFSWIVGLENERYGKVFGYKVFRKPSDITDLGPRGELNRGEKQESQRLKIMTFKVAFALERPIGG